MCLSVCFLYTSCYIVVYANECFIRRAGGSECCVLYVLVGQLYVLILLTCFSSRLRVFSRLTRLEPSNQGQ